MIVKQKKMDKSINYKINLKTIFASASSLGLSAIKTIRISGKESKKIFRLLTKKKNLKARYYNLVKLFDIKDSSIIDKAVVIWFPKPKTYTGEDMLEIHIHGGNAVLQHLTKNLLSIENVKEAEAGEFTKRAFSNNKMDFLEAEAVNDLINADTKFQKKLAIQQLEGTLSNVLNNWNKKIIKILAYYEGLIDFDESEVPKITEKKIFKQVSDLIDEINIYLLENKRGEIIRNGIEVVVIGKPNVGKSSLINQLLKRDVAIVSKISGTTRDIIESKFNLAGIPIILSDTAGLKKKIINSVEKKGILKAKTKIKRSNIKLLVLDIRKKIDDETLNLICDKTIVILNKIDLVKKKELINKINSLSKNYNNKIYSISAKKGSGIISLLENLENYIKLKYKDVFFGEPVLTKLRHRSYLKKCLFNLKKIKKNKQPELNAEDLRLSLNALESVTGKYNVEKLLDIVFKDFCVGK